ncbi:hypothetical protein LTR17_027724 [Elasticomyces elasticus]|nr:hypothetical protein LTR17_027724 [Elasticomyces elasticus]
MDNFDLPRIGTPFCFANDDIDLFVPQAPLATIDPTLLQIPGWGPSEPDEDDAVVSIECDGAGHGGESSSSSTASSPPAHAITPPPRRRRKPGSWRRAYPSHVEKKYRTKLQTGWTALSDAISTIRGSSDEGVPAGEIKPAKNKKKHTVIMKAVEYIKHLEDENGTLLAMLADTLLGDHHSVKRTPHHVVNDGDVHDVEAMRLTSWQSSLGMQASPNTLRIFQLNSV